MLGSSDAAHEVGHDWSARDAVRFAVAGRRVLVTDGRQTARVVDLGTGKAARLDRAVRSRGRGVRRSGRAALLRRHRRRRALLRGGRPTRAARRRAPGMVQEGRSVRLRAPSSWRLGQRAGGARLSERVDPRRRQPAPSPSARSTPARRCRCSPASPPARTPPTGRGSYRRWIPAQVNGGAVDIAAHGGNGTVT